MSLHLYSLIFQHNMIVISTIYSRFLYVWFKWVLYMFCISNVYTILYIYMYIAYIMLENNLLLIICIYNMAACFPETSHWCWNKQVCLWDVLCIALWVIPQIRFSAMLQLTCIPVYRFFRDIHCIHWHRSSTMLIASSRAT